jgi:hypothetical protein
VATADGGILKTRTVAVETAAAAAIGTEGAENYWGFGTPTRARPDRAFLGFFDRFIRPRFSTIRFPFVLGRLKFP